MVITLGTWTHTLDPVAFQLGPLTVHWYGLAYIAGFIIAALLLKKMASRGWVRFEQDRVIDLILSIGLFGVFIGGRLGYVLFYRRDLLTEFSWGSPPWWGVLRINEGGMASHGGMIGVLLVLWWSARRMKVSMLHLLDAACLVAPAGLFLGRIANFINGELLGRIIAKPGEVVTSIWYGVRFPQELVERPGESGWTNEQQIEAMRIAGAAPGESMESVGTRLAGWFQQDEGGGEVRRLVEPLLSVRHPSQLYQAFAEGIVVFAVLWWIWRKPRKDGVILSWFLIVYGVGRIATEFWRLPDAHLGASAEILGLSRGQQLSALMVLGGVCVLLWAVRRSDATQSGGWRLAGARKNPAAPVPDAGSVGSDAEDRSS